MSRNPSQPRVWVGPSRRSPGLLAVIVAMWYAGASQGNGAAYLLCCVLLSLALVSIIHTWRNVRGITVTAHRISPVFVGEELMVPIVVASERRHSHFAIKIAAASGKRSVEVEALDPTRPERRELPLLALRRGFFREIPVRVSSSFPLGFFTARLSLVASQSYHVYPAPLGDLPLPRALAPTRQPQSGLRIEGDDYGGVRVWQPGESQRHIDWKAAARGQPLLTKQWTGEVDEILCLDWQFVGAVEDETRLSQLARWVVLAERGSAAYELHLPGRIIQASRGDNHYHECLRALAEFPSSTGGPQR